MPSTATEAAPKNDAMGTILTVALVLVVAVYTTSYEQVPELRSILATSLAGLSLGLAYTAALANFRRAMPLLLALLMVTIITATLQWAEIPQDYNVLLRYLTALAGIFAMHMIRIPNLTRFMAYVSMAVIAHAGYITATGGNFFYAGTVRTWPFWSGLANSSFFVAAMLIVISLSPVRRFFKVAWVGAGMVVLAGYGAVTAMLMVALFYAGWYFLYRGWKRTWLFIIGAIAVVVGVLFRNANSAAGADIESLGVGAVGSGRLDSWLGRLVDFADRDVATMLLGEGPYSDYQLSDLWYWAEKNAHSDLVTILMEFGLIGFIALVALGVSSYKRSNPLGHVAILAIGLGAMASNTFIDRPAVAIAWGMVLYACGYHEVMRKEPRTAGIEPPKIPNISPAHQRLFENASRQNKVGADQLAAAGIIPVMMNTPDEG